MKTPRPLASIYTLGAGKLGTISRRLADNVICVATSGASLAEPLYLHIPYGWPDRGFLIVADPRAEPLVLRHANWSSRIMPFRVGRLAGSALVRISDPYLKMYVAVRPGEAEAAGFEVALTPDPRESTPFTLTPVAGAPAAVTESGRRLKEILQTSSGGVDVLDALARTDAGHDAVEALGRFIPRDDDDRLGRRVSSQPALVGLLQRTHQDLWAREALPGLSRWLGQDRRGDPFPRRIDAAFDGLDSARPERESGTFSARCSRLARQAVAPRRAVCALAAARNEGLYLVDWLAYHRALGIEDVFLYTNDNDDGSDALLSALNDAGYIKLIFNDVAGDVRAQYKAYGHALQMLPDILDYKWTAVIDIDEFIVLNSDKYENLVSYLDMMERSGADSIALPWAWHDPQEAVLWDDRPVNARFPAYRPDHFRHVKSIFRPNRFAWAQCHFPFDDALRPRSYRTADGRFAPPGPFRDEVFCDDAWVSHHLFKSLEELLVRRCRNRGDSIKSEVSGDTIHSEFLNIYLGEPTSFTVQPTRQLTLGPELRAKIEREKALILQADGVRAADAACKAWFRPESDRVRAKLAEEPRFQVPGSVDARALERLDRAIAMPRDIP